MRRPSGSSLKNGRREVPGPIPDRACQPRRPEFSLIFSETHVNMGYDPLKDSPWKALLRQAQVPQADSYPKSYNPTQQPIIFCAL